MKQVLRPKNWRSHHQSQLQKQGSDIESHEMSDDVEHSRQKLDLNHYRIVNEIWHFISVDWGHRCKSQRGVCSITHIEIYKIRPSAGISSTRLEPT